MTPSMLLPTTSVAMTALAACVILGPPVAWWLAARRRAAGWLAGVSLVAILLLTLSPTRRDMRIGCAIDLSPQLMAPEPLANVLLFVPLALALAVATRRPVRAALGASTLSAGIELVQAVVTPIGRSCDTSDWFANTGGAIIGAALAAVGLAAARWQRREADARSAGAGIDRRFP